MAKFLHLSENDLELIASLLHRGIHDQNHYCSTTHIGYFKSI